MADIEFTLILRSDDSMLISSLGMVKVRPVFMTRSAIGPVRSVHSIIGDTKLDYTSDSEWRGANWGPVLCPRRSVRSN